jgi:hypothetical protein
MQEPSAKRKKIPDPAKKAVWLLNYVAIAVASAVLLGFWSFFTLQAFAQGSFIGFRSLAAGVLPILVTVYITFYTDLMTPPNQVPLFNVFFVASVWTLLIFLTIQLTYTPTFPLPEFLFSVTSSLMVLSYSRVSKQGFISYSYGIVVGFLIYVMSFGPVNR